MATELYIEIMPLVEFQKFMERLPGIAMEIANTTLNEMAEEAVKKSQAEFGNYQASKPGPDGTAFPAWAALKPSTILRKRVRTGQNTPLLDSGELQESVEDLDLSPLVKMVGTYDPNGRRHEYGTSRAPARPWLRPVLFSLKAPFERMLRRNLIMGIRSKYSKLKES